MIVLGNKVWRLGEMRKFGQLGGVKICCGVMFLSYYG